MKPTRQFGPAIFGPRILSTFLCALGMGSLSFAQVPGVASSQMGVFSSESQSQVCQEQLRFQAEWKQLLKRQLDALSRVRLHKGAARSSVISIDILEAHLLQLAHFILGSVSAATAFTDGNIFFTGPLNHAHVNLSRFLDGAHPADQHDLEKWIRQLLALQLKMQLYRGHSYAEALKAVQTAEKMVWLTHPTPRVQRLVEEVYPGILKVFLVSELEPLQAGVVDKADLVIYSEGGGFDLPTVASQVFLVGGEADLCQTQTIADFARTSGALDLNLEVNTDLSYIEDQKSRFTLRQQDLPQEEFRAIKSIEGELDLLLGDAFYHRKKTSVLKPGDPAFPRSFFFSKTTSSKQKGPRTVQVRYE